MWVEKNILWLQGAVVHVVKQKSAFQHTWFSNNQWFCLEITIWAVHSFALNFVKKLCCIVWDPTTNLIKFHWILLRLVLLTWIILQFFVHFNSKTLRVDPWVKWCEVKVVWKKASQGFRVQCHWCSLAKKGC